MNEIFKQYIDKFIIYLDDVLIFCNTVDEHQMHLQKIFKKPEEFNLKVNGKKCEFFRKQIHFLGHTVSGLSIGMDREKLCYYLLLQAIGRIYTFPYV